MRAGGCVDHRVGIGLSYVLPMVVPELGGEPRRFHERLKQHRRAANHVAKHPGHDDDEVRFGSRLRGNLESQLGSASFANKYQPFNSSPRASLRFRPS